MMAQLWRDALRGRSDTHVVANADDPMVVWAASGCDRRSPGSPPGSAGTTTPGSARSAAARSSGPTTAGRRAGTAAVAAHPTATGTAPAASCAARLHSGHSTATPWSTRTAPGTRSTLQLPGRVNRANAATALAVAAAFGVDPAEALPAAGPGRLDRRPVRHRCSATGAPSGCCWPRTRPAGWRRSTWPRTRRRCCPSTRATRTAWTPRGCYDVDFAPLRGRPGTDHRRPGDRPRGPAGGQRGPVHARDARSPRPWPRCRPGASRSSPTTPRSRTSERSWTVSTEPSSGRRRSRHSRGGRDRVGAAHRLDLPGPAVDLRRPGQPADPGAPGRPARAAGADHRGALRPAGCPSTATSTCSAAARTGRRRWPRSG